MDYEMFPRTCLLLWAALLLLSPSTEAQELRAFWADTFHAGMRTSAEVTALVSAVRAAQCNAVFVEVRKRGDAYYRNGLEPVASDVAAGFDPLGDLISKAHSGTPRIDVHAWVVTYNIWNGENSSPIQPSHPYNLHPDWLSEDNTGAKWAGNAGGSGNYQFDQGHPAVQQHTFDVVMDILRRYDIDGLHFDYIRYSDYNSRHSNQPWGYNPVSLARYKRLKNVTAIPAPTDATWLQWRRDQVTALLRKVYLNAWAAKPNVRVSAALIAYGSAPANLNLTSWQASEAYGRVLQDWRGWMEEGILDLACPMVYGTDNTRFAGWANFAKERQYNRAAAIGMGWYLNSVSNTIAQVKSARTLSSSGKTAVGVLGYSYAVPNSDGLSRTATWAAFTDDAAAETYDPGGAPIFGSVATVPPMSWKTNATKGHVMGRVGTGTSNSDFDGATVTLAGPTNRSLVTDATGFFGAVDIPSGTYSLNINLPGYRPLSKSVTVTNGMVAEATAALEQVPLQIVALTRNAGASTLTITWTSVPRRRYRVEASQNAQQWSAIASNISATAAGTSYVWPIPVTWQDKGFVRVVEEP